MPNLIGEHALVTNTLRNETQSQSRGCIKAAHSRFSQSDLCFLRYLMFKNPFGFGFCGAGWELLTEDNQGNEEGRKGSKFRRIMLSPVLRILNLPSSPLGPYGLPSPDWNLSLQKVRFLWLTRVSNPALFRLSARVEVLPA